MTSNDPRPRLLFHVQHMLGIGHRVRGERIARACVDAGFDVTLMEGGVPDNIRPEDDPVGLTRIQLPPAKSADAAFSGVVDAVTGLPIDDDWRERRATASLDVLNECHPNILLLEGFPFARRAFRFELLPLIAAAREAGARTAVSIRDILVLRKDRRKDSEIAEIARAAFDAILVHGDPGFAQLADSFAAAPGVADKLIYTGIVGPPPPASGVAHHGDVIVSAGGGATGGALIRAAIAARPISSLSERTWRIMIGPNLPDGDRAALEKLPDGILAEPARADFLDLLAGASVSISQAGYNTVADLAVSGCPAVLVPFEGPGGGETEQPTRARLLARAGRAVCVPEKRLDARSIAQAIDEALALPRSDRAFYRMAGAESSARALLSLLGDRT